MRLRVTWHRAGDLATDFDAQLARGGVLVRIDPPDALQPFTAVPLELIAPDGEALLLDAQVLQAFPGAGVAVTFAANEALTSWAAAAKSSAGEGGDTEHAFLTAADLEASPRTSVAPSRISLALRGARDERTAILRDNVPQLHGYVLRNPGLQLDEVTAIAKMRTVTPQLLQQIADRREWAQRPEIAIALVRNPKTPVGVAVRLLEHVTAADLRQLAKDTNTRTPIQHAARRKVIGG